MTIKYKYLAQNDAIAFRVLRLESLQRYPNNYTGTYAHEVKRDVAWFADYISRNNAYGAFDGDELVGTVALAQDTRPRNGHKAHLEAVYVTPKQQGRGIAKALLAYAFESAIKYFEHVLLAADSNNHAAIAVYEHLGFTQYGHEPNAAKLDDGYLDDILMIKFLKELP